MTFFMSYPINRHRNHEHDRMRGSVPDVVKSMLIYVQNSFNSLQSYEILRSVAEMPRL